MINIVPFERKHLDGICEVEKSCFKTPWSRKSFENELENPLARYFVLLKDGSVAGYAGMRHIIDEGDIMNIGVLPSERRQGFGSLLLNALIKYMNDNSLCLLTLEVRASNKAAIHLYEKHGFYMVGCRKNYYDGKEDALLLRRDRLEHTGD